MKSSPMTKCGLNMTAGLGASRCVHRRRAKLPCLHSDRSGVLFGAGMHLFVQARSRHWRLLPLSKVLKNRDGTEDTIMRSREWARSQYDAAADPILTGAVSEPPCSTSRAPALVTQATAHRSCD